MRKKNEREFVNFGNTADKAFDLFIYLSPDHNIRFANDACSELIGIAKHELIGKQIQDLVSPAECKQFVNQLELSLLEEIAEFHTGLKDSRGKEHSLECRIRALFDKNAGIDSFLILLRKDYEEAVSPKSDTEKDSLIKSLKSELNNEIEARKKYRKTMTMLQKRMNLEYEIVKLTRDMSFDKSNEEKIGRILQVFGDAIKADCGFLFKCEEKPANFRIVQRFFCKDDSKCHETLTMPEWLLKYLEINDNLYVHSKDDIADRYRKDINAVFGDFCSIVLIPLKVNKRLTGFFGFISIDNSFKFLFDDFTLFGVVGKLLLSDNTFTQNEKFPKRDKF